MFKFKLDSGSGAGMTNGGVYELFSGRKAELFMLLRTGSFHFALTPSTILFLVGTARIASRLMLRANCQFIPRLDKPWGFLGNLLKRVDYIIDSLDICRAHARVFSAANSALRRSRDIIWDSLFKSSSFGFNWSANEIFSSSVFTIFLILFFS